MISILSAGHCPIPAKCFLLLSIPKMAQIGWNIYVAKSAGYESNAAEILRNTWRFALAAGVQFLIGFFLFIGAELFSTLWYKSVKRLKYERNITRGC